MLNIKWFDGQVIFGRFINRRNRFVMDVEIDGRIQQVYLANPGRLSTVLLSGRKVALLKKRTNTLNYHALAVKKNEEWVVVQATKVNRVFEALVSNKKLNSFMGCSIVQTEPRSPSGRFDFLLNCDGKEKLVEVKSCTQVSNGFGMFPDAPTSRGTRHVTELIELGGSIVFMVFGRDLKGFFPDYHVDPNFTDMLIQAKDKVEIKAFEIDMNEDLTINNAKEIPIVWDKIKSTDDSGSYVLIIRVEEPKTIPIGALGNIDLRHGWYVYVGRAMKNLSARIARHKRRKKKLKWHIDYLTTNFGVVWTFVIRGMDVEDSIAKQLQEVADNFIDGFGSSDSRTKSHLFYFEKDPRVSKEFIDLLWGYKTI